MCAVRDFLHELVSAAVDELPGCGAALSVLRDGERQLAPAVATDARAHRLDVAGVAEGPHALAVERDAVVHLADATTDRRWPAYARLMLTEGITSLIVFPLDIDERPTMVGMLAVYSPEPHLFESTDRNRYLRRVATEATRALALAARLALIERRSVDLERALASRATIDQAVGILMAENRCTADDAFAVLIRASQHRNLKLRSIAREIVARVGGEEPTSVPRFR